MSGLSLQATSVDSATSVEKGGLRSFSALGTDNRTAGQSRQSPNGH